MNFNMSRSQPNESIEISEVTARSSDISPFHSAHTISIDVLTMALSRVVSGIFNVEKCHDNEIGV